MLLSGDVDELEVEEESRRDPAINGIVRMKSRVINHPLNKLSVHLDDKLRNSDGVQLSMLEGTEEAVELEFRLRVVRLAVIEGDGAEMTRILLLILSELEDNIADTVHTRIDGEKNWTTELMVDGMQSRRVGD